MISEVIV